VWDLETELMVISQMPGIRDTSDYIVTSHTIMFSDDGTQIITYCVGNRIENIRIWDFPSGDLLTTYDIPLHNFGLLTSNGDQVVIGEGGSWDIYDINTMEVILSSAEEESASFFRFSPDNQILYTNNWITAQVTAWDANTGERIYTFGECDVYCHGEGPMEAFIRFGLSNDGRRLAVIDAFYRTISIWDTQTRALIQSFDPEGSVYDIVISGDGTLVAALTYSHETHYRRIWIWHLLP
jgi:WD40 repeat protein